MFCRLSGWTVLKRYWLKFGHPTGRHLAPPLGGSSVTFYVDVARTVYPNVRGTRRSYTVSQPKKSALWMCLLYFVKHLPGRKVFLFQLAGWMKLCPPPCTKCLYDMPFLKWYVHFILNVTSRLCWVYRCMEGNEICPKILICIPSQQVCTAVEGTWELPYIVTCYREHPVGIPLKKGIDTGWSDHFNNYVRGSPSVFYSTAISRFILLLPKH